MQTFVSQIYLLETLPEAETFGKSKLNIIPKVLFDIEKHFYTVLLLFLITKRN